MAQLINNGADASLNVADLVSDISELYGKQAWATSGIGYATGAGGTVTQATSKSTTVTLNKNCGTIVMNGAALAAGGRVAFVCNNSLVGQLDAVIVNVQNVGTVVPANYLVWASPSSGGIVFTLYNVSAGSMSDVVTLNFSVVKVVAS